MRRHEERLLLSAGDLVTFLGCRHATALDLRALDEPLEKSAPDPTLSFLQTKGIEHELDYLRDLEDRGYDVLRIPDDRGLVERIRLTVEAMRAGAPAIYQAALTEKAWHGFADFLVRVDTPSHFGTWSYEAADTKLASHISPRYVAQLSLYSRLLSALQGIAPRHMQVVLGNGVTEILRTDDFSSYMRLAGERLEEFIDDENACATTAAEPCAQCRLCHWQDRCDEEWERADHLSLVANIRSTQAEKLRAVGVQIVAALAELGPDRRIPGMTPEALSKPRDQARLQVAVRGTDRHEFQLLPLRVGRGFALMPRPSEGDLFFDMEGDPLYPGGLEYLFGVHHGPADGGTFRPFWGHDRDEERQAFEQFIDYVTIHLARYPEAYIYHYNHYEVTAIRRLAMMHGTRESLVDDLLRQKKFVDLFKVVRQSLLISEPRYSLKNVERFYRGKRDGDVASAADSIVAYETWRITKDPQILRDIERYNAIDCRSTAGLRDWLISIRPEGVAWLDPAMVAPDEEALVLQRQAEAERQQLGEQLLAGVPQQEIAVRKLIIDLVDFHRREQKPAWWALFDRQGREEDELIEDADCLGGLRLVGEPIPEKRSLVHTYEFPPQETKLTRGDRPVVVHTTEPAGSIEEFDVRRGVLKLKRSKAKGPLPADLSLGPVRPLNDQCLRLAIRRFADSVARGDGKFLALERFLRRETPSLKGRAAGFPVLSDGADLIQGTTDAVAAMDDSHLFIQGPPGTGKTYTAGHVIVEMLRRGKKIGVASHSHKAINNLLAKIEAVANSAGAQFEGYKKATAGDATTEHAGAMIANAFSNGDIPPEADLIAGTAWLFADPAFEASRDYLFVDEAGQVSLANLLAMGTAARNIVLVGDQMQLGQPIQGAHPGESGASALDYLLQGAATVPPGRGIFLDVSWRMHPDLGGWVSEAIYEGRLKAHPSTSEQRLVLNGMAHPVLRPHGLRFVPVHHHGRSQCSPEEAEMVKEVWTNLMGQRWRDRHGKEHSFTVDDVLVVAPYNVQVNFIKGMLPTGARVGTVDKFQGQEAAVVLVSMTTSSGEDLPRDIEFLFSRNRLNVAVSRTMPFAGIGQSAPAGGRVLESR